MIGIWYVIGWSTCSATWLFTSTRCGCKEDTMEGSVSPGWFGFRWQRMVAEDLQIPFEPSLGEGHSVGSESQNYPRRIGLNSHISPSIHPVLPVPNRDFGDFPIFSHRPTMTHPTSSTRPRTFGAAPTTPSTSWTATRSAWCRSGRAKRSWWTRGPSAWSGPAAWRWRARTAPGKQSDGAFGMVML